MSLVRFFGQLQEQATAVDESGRWARWVAGEPALSAAGSAAELGQLVTDRSDPARANEFLHALVRVGSVDGGDDEVAATFVASLLVPGGDRMARSLWSLGGEVEQIVAGQLWIQVRVYPWRVRPRAVAKNILMETRRAVLADFGAATPVGVPLVPLPPLELKEVIEQRTADLTTEPSPDQVLLNVLVWARARGVLTDAAATLLWDLVVLACDSVQCGGLPWMARGTGSLDAATRVADTRGLTARSVRRQRDRAVSALRLVQDDYTRDDTGDRDRTAVRALAQAGAPSRDGGRS